MALDTRGLASGFAQGFGLMEQHQQRKLNNDRADRQEQRQARQDERADQEWGMRMEDRAKAQSLEQIRAFYEQEAAGLMPEMTQELDQAFELHPHLRLDNVYSEDTARSVQIAEQLATGDMDPNAPEAIEALNQFLAPEIQAGDGEDLEPGQTVQKRIVGVYPGQDSEHLSFDLEVTIMDADGNPVRSYNAPMTPGHSASDDEVLQVPMERLINAAVGMKGLQQAIPEEVRQQRMQYLRQIGVIKPGDVRWEDVDGPGGSLLQRNQQTGEMRQVIGRAPSLSGGANGQFAPGAIERDMEYLRRIFPNESNDEIYSRAIKRAGDGVSPAQRISALRALIPNLENTVLTAETEEERQEAAARLSSAKDELYQLSVRDGKQPGGSQPPPGLQMPQQSAPQAEQPQQTIMQDSEDIDDQLRQLW